jgi:hypothetical protein
MLIFQRKTMQNFLKFEIKNNFPDTYLINAIFLSHKTFWGGQPLTYYKKH